MQKLKIYLLPLMILMISIFIMLSGGFLKKPLGKDDDVLKYMNVLADSIDSEQWETAEENLIHLQKTWSKVEKRIQFSVERDDMNSLTVDLARIEGAIRVRSREMALIELYEAIEHWEHLEK